MTAFPKSRQLISPYEEAEQQQEDKKTQLNPKDDLFYSLFENSFDPILVTKPDGSILSANPAACNMFGMTEAELKKVGREGVVVLDEKAKAALSRREREGKAKAELTLKRKDGSIFNAEVSSRLFTDVEGTVKTSMIIRDITEHKKMEEILRQSEERFRAVFEKTALGIAIGDPTGHLIKCNGAFQRMLGYSEKELCDKVFSEFTHPIDAKKEWSLVEEIVAGKRDYYKIEKRYIRKDGQIFWGQTISNPIYGPDKKTVMAIATIEDISERKKAEEGLRQAKQRLEAHMKNAPEAIIEFDPQYRVIRWSDEAQRIFGWSKDEILGKAIAEMPWVYEDDVELVQQLSLDMINGKRPRSVSSNRNYRKDGAVIYCEWYNSALYDPDGKLTSVLSFVLDVTERRKMQEKLEEYAKNLEGLVEERTNSLRDAERLAAIGATAGMVGHDIRNPLQAIISEVYIAESDLTSLPDSEARQSLMNSLREINMSADYINKIVADLQDFVRPLNPSISEVDLKSLIEELLLKATFPENIHASSQVEQDVKAVQSDGVFLKRILGNLISNAVQAMPNGGELYIHAYADADDVVIAVEDTGVGVPNSLKSKLFTPLFTTKSKGQGFGLAVAKRLVESLGGSVSFESKEGKGSTFSLHIPKNIQVE